MKKRQDVKGSIWKITSPKGQIFILSTVDEDLEFRRKIKSSTRGNLVLQKSIAAHGLKTHKFEKLEKDIPRAQLTTRKREIIMSISQVPKRAKQKMVQATPEEFRSRIEECDPTLSVPLYDISIQVMLVEREGKWIEISKTRFKRIRGYEEPNSRTGILDRMEMFTDYMQIGDGNQIELDGEEEELNIQIPEED